MALARRYTKKFSVEVEKSKEEVVQSLHKLPHPYIVENDTIEITLKPALSNLLNSAGKISVRMADGEQPNKKMLHCRLTPLLFQFNVAQVVFFGLLILVFVIIVTTPFSIYSALAIVAIWILITLAAFPVLLFAVIAWTIIVLFLSFHTYTFIFIVVGWLFVAWLRHIILRYNRARLRRACLKWIRHLKGEKEKIKKL